MDVDCPPAAAPGWLSSAWARARKGRPRFTPLAGIVADRYERKQILLVGFVVLAVISSLLAVLLPIVADDTFGKGSGGLTALAAISGIGSVAGAIATGVREATPRMASAAALVAAFGVSFVLFGLAPTWPGALVMVAVVGAFYFWAMTTINALLQGLADDARRGRLMALFVVAWAGLVPIGALWQGAFAGAFGARAAVAVAGTITAAYALVVLAFGPHRDRPALAYGGVD